MKDRTSSKSSVPPPGRLIGLVLVFEGFLCGGRLKPLLFPKGGGNSQISTERWWWFVSFLVKGGIGNEDG